MTYMIVWIDYKLTDTQIYKYFIWLQLNAYNVVIQNVTAQNRVPRDIGDLQNMN